MTLINKELNISVLGFGDAGISHETIDYSLENRYSKRVQFTEQEPMIKGAIGVTTLNQSAFDYLFTWFNVVRGKEKSWLLRVPGYNRISHTVEDAGNGQTKQGVLFPIAGSGTNYQITLATNGSEINSNKPILFPVQNTIKVYSNGVQLTSGFVVDTLGVVIFSALPTGVLTVDCTYLTPVRFDTDIFAGIYVRDNRYLEDEIHELGQFVSSSVPCQIWHEAESLPFVEVLPPF